MLQRERLWVLRALAAGLLASAIGLAIGTTGYLALPGALELDWSLMVPILVGYAGLCAFGGIGIAAGMHVVARGREHARVPLRSLLAGATVGGMLGCLVPGVVGIAGFGSIAAPYAGSANILFSLLAASTVFVAVWAPRLSNPDALPRLGVVGRFGLAAIAATVTAASLGTLCGALLVTLDALPTLEWLRSIADALGLAPLAVIASIVLGAASGVFMAVACWMYLTFAIALDGRRDRRVA